MDTSGVKKELESLNATLSGALHSAYQAIAGILEKHGVNLDDEAVGAATKVPEEIMQLPPNKGGIWPKPSVRSLCDWRALIHDMRTEEDFDRKYYQAVLDVLNTGMMDVAHVHALWALDAAVNFIEVRSEALQELLDTRTSGRGIAGINDPSVKQNMEAIAAVIETYNNAAADLHSYVPSYVGAIQNQVLKENELYRLVDESE